MNASTVIVGGGISGLALAHALERRGQGNVRVLEASPTPGGTIQSSLSSEGFLTEAGPNGFLDREPATFSLVERLGLSAKLRAAAPSSKLRFVFTRGALREVPASPPAFMRSDVLPLSARLRLAAEIFSARSREEDESLASFARRHLGKRAAAVLVDAMQSGIFAGDPERLSLASTFPRMAQLEREHRSLILALMRLQRAARRQGQSGPEAGGPSGKLWSLEGGLHTLVDGLVGQLGTQRVHTGARVQRLSRVDGRWSLSVVDDAGRASTLEAQRVVLATPAYVTADLLRPVDASLAEDVGGISYAPVAAVHLGFSQLPQMRSPDGFGFLVPHEEGGNLLGALYISSIFPWRAPEGHALLTCMMGGVRQGALVAESDASLVELARQELRRALGLNAPPLFCRITRWQRGIPQYEVGHARRLVRLEERLGALPGLYFHGNAYRGVGLNDCVRESERLAEQLVCQAGGDVFAAGSPTPR